MSEDFGDKTEAPTPRRRQEAREQGNIARSTDLTASAIIIGTMMLLNSYGKGVVNALQNLLKEMLSSNSLNDWSEGSLFTALARGFMSAGLALMPIFVGVMVIAIVINVLQVGLVLNGKR